MAVAILQADLGKERARPAWAEAVARDVGIVPPRVFCGEQPVSGLNASVIDLAREPVAINGAGDGLAKFLVPKPLEFGRIHQGFAQQIGSRVLVEREES